MELISREALLEDIDKEREYLLARGQTGAEHILVHNFRELAINAPTVCEMYGDIPKYNERPQGEWTPVSERLPEENGEYLVTREAYIDRENRNMIFVRDIAWFTSNYELNNGFHKANTVIAWQPLPELYKGGGADMGGDEK